MKNKLLVLCLATLTLVGCNNSKPKQVEFMLSTDQPTQVEGKAATVYVDWKQNDHIIKFSSFTFTADPIKTNEISFEQTGNPRPMPVTITFDADIIEDINGTLSFAYEDTTAKTTGNSSISITIPSDPTIPASITLSDDKETLVNGVTAPYTLTATVLPETAIDKSVTWTSSDPSIVEVTDGQCYAKSIGDALITAKTCNGLTATCEIKVSEPVIVDMESGEMVTHHFSKPGTTVMELNSVTYNSYVDEGTDCVGIEFTEIKWTCISTTDTSLTNRLWCDIKDKNGDYRSEGVYFAEEEPDTTEVGKQYTCTTTKKNNLPLSGAPYTISLYSDE